MARRKYSGNRALFTKVLVLAIALVVIIIVFSSVTGYQIGGPGFEANISMDKIPPKLIYWGVTDQDAPVGGSVTLHGCWEENKGIKDADLYTDEIGSMRKADLGYSEKYDPEFNCTFIGFDYAIPEKIGAVISWTINVTDIGNHKSATPTGKINVIDVYSPEWYNQSQSMNNVIQGQHNTLSVRWTDDVGLARAILETNETAGIPSNVTTVTLTGKEDWSNFTWRNPEVPSNTAVEWKVYGVDAFGNKAVTGTMLFQVIPAPPPQCTECPECTSCSDWSECTAGLQSRICYQCDDTTGYEWKPYTETQACEIGVTATEALNEIKSAQSIIDLARLEGKDVLKAETLLSQARNYFDNGEYRNAVSYAQDAEHAVKVAGVITKRKDGAYVPVIIVIIALSALAAAVLLHTGKIKLPLKIGKPTEAGADEMKVSEAVCGICGNPMSKTYTCSECGTKVCFEHARSHKGKIYCVSCLRRKGMI